MVHIICDECGNAMDCIESEYSGNCKDEVYQCEDCNLQKYRQIEYDKDNVPIRDEVYE